MLNIFSALLNCYLPYLFIVTVAFWLSISSEEGSLLLFFVLQCLAFHAIIINNCSAETSILHPTFKQWMKHECEVCFSLLLLLKNILSIFPSRNEFCWNGTRAILLFPQIFPNRHCRQATAHYYTNLSYLNSGKNYTEEEEKNIRSQFCWSKRFYLLLSMV